MNFTGGNTKDNNRSIHTANDLNGDPRGTEGSYEVQLKQPSPQMWGVGKDQNADLQAMPDPSLMNDGQEDVSRVIAGRGDADLLGATIAEESSMKDDNYPGLSSGRDGKTDLSGSFGSIGPYDAPDFGNWPGGTSGNSFLPGFSAGD